MAADQIFVVALVLACMITVGWMSISSHKAEKRRRLSETPTETDRPGPDRRHDDA